MRSQTIGRRILGAITVAVVALAWTGGGRAAAQSKQAHYQTYAVDVAVQPDGTFDVVEDITVSFDAGAFTTGYVDLSREGAAGIHGARVDAPDQPYAEGDGDPNTFSVTPRGDLIRVQWWFPEIRAPRSARFIVQYTVTGALRAYEGGDQLWWTVIRPDRPLVENAVITVTLPDAVPGWTDGSGYVQPRPNAAWRPVPADRVSDRVLRIRVEDVENGASVEVRGQWPHGYVQATETAFQADLDAERVDEQAEIDAARGGATSTGQTDGWLALFNLIVALLSVVALASGLFGVYWVWYQRGRDPEFDLGVDYLAEPPSDLAPAVVGTLLDDEAQLRGIVANAKMTFKDSFMPAFYKTDGFIRPGDGFTGKAAKGELPPILSAQQIEDVVAYLKTLKE